MNSKFNKYKAQACPGSTLKGSVCAKKTGLIPLVCFVATLKIFKDWNRCIPHKSPVLILKKERNLNKFPRPGLAFVKENGVKLKKNTKKEEQINLVRRPFSISATGCYRTGRIPRESRGLRDFYVWCFPGPLISSLQSSQSKQTRHVPDVEFLRFFKFFRNETEI